MRRLFETIKFLYSGDSDKVETLRKQFQQAELEVIAVSNTLHGVMRATLNRVREIKYLVEELEQLESVLLRTIDILEFNKHQNEK